MDDTMNDHEMDIEELDEWFDLYTTSSEEDDDVTDKSVKEGLSKKQKKRRLQNQQIRAKILRNCGDLSWIWLQTLQLLRLGVGKKPNYRIIGDIHRSLLSEITHFYGFSESLHDLLTNLPLDTASIASTIHNYLLFLPLVQVRPLEWFYQWGNFMMGLAKTHEDFAKEPIERNARRYFNNLHRDLKLQLQLGLHGVITELEVAVFLDLFDLRFKLNQTVEDEIEGYMVRKRSEFDQFARRCWDLQSWECRSHAEKTFCMLSDKLTSDDDLIETDECRERRFVYDGSYYEGNCTSWLHFRNLFLNSVVSVAFGGQSSIRPLAQRLAIADAESRPDEASNTLPQSSRHSEDGNSNPHDNASVYDEHLTLLKIV